LKNLALVIALLLILFVQSLSYAQNSSSQPAPWVNEHEYDLVISKKRISCSNDTIQISFIVKNTTDSISAIPVSHIGLVLLKGHTGYGYIMNKRFYTFVVMHLKSNSGFIGQSDDILSYEIDYIPKVLLIEPKDSVFFSIQKYIRNDIKFENNDNLCENCSLYDVTYDLPYCNYSNWSEYTEDLNLNENLTDIVDVDSFSIIHSKIDDVYAFAPNNHSGIKNDSVTNRKLIYIPWKRKTFKIDGE